MSVPTVSIITPTYNRPILLRRAIQSVLQQSFTAWEMVVVDDGSQEPAESIVAGFGDVRLRCIRQAHAGRSAARNRGLEAAVGKYISFLDDDDLYCAGKLAHEIAAFDANPDIEMTGCGYRLYLEKDDINWKSIEPWKMVPGLNAGNCLFSCPLITCSVLVSRNAIDGLEHRFDPSLDQCEDLDFFLRLLLAGAQFAWVKEVLCEYRITNDYPSSWLLDWYRNHRQVLSIILKSHPLPTEIRQQSQKILLNHDLQSACKAYACQLEKNGKRFLLLALVREPRLADELSGRLLDGFLNYAKHSSYVSDPEEFLDFVFGHLPAPLKHLAERRNEAYRQL